MLSGGNPPGKPTAVGFHLFWGKPTVVGFHFFGGNPPLVRLQLLTMKCGGFPPPKGGNPPHEQIDDNTVG